jgi:predicted GNAT family acetyltransferase
LESASAHQTAQAPEVHTSAVFILNPLGCHDRAVLLYEYVGKRIVDLQHTEVPDAYRGRGIAKHLAKVGWTAERDTKATTLPVRRGWAQRLTPACFMGRAQPFKPTWPMGCGGHWVDIAQHSSSSLVTWGTWPPFRLLICRT